LSKRKIRLRPGHAGYRTKANTPTVPPPRPQPIKLPSTRQIDARIRRQSKKYAIWREQYLRLKDEGGRWWRGPRPRKPPEDVYTHIYPTGTLVFYRRPGRRHPHVTEYVVPRAAVHPTLGPLYHLDSAMAMHYHFLRTIPSRRLLVSRGPTPQDSVTFKALSQEWVRVPSDRSNRIGYHRWLCCLVVSTCSTLSR
jgi:hypothetical protein